MGIHAELEKVSIYEMTQFFKASNNESYSDAHLLTYVKIPIFQCIYIYP
jgi:hypothetical protein